MVLMVMVLVTLSTRSVGSEAWAQEVCGTTSTCKEEDGKTTKALLFPVYKFDECKTYKRYKKKAESFDKLDREFDNLTDESNRQLGALRACEVSSGQLKFERDEYLVRSTALKAALESRWAWYTWASLGFVTGSLVTTGVVLWVAAM